MQTDTQFSLPELSPWRKARMLKHAEHILQAQHSILTNTGKGILHYTLQKKRKFVKMNHHPKGDRIDHKTGAQYFYHCHREDLSSEEHGHFHCFLRYPQIPKHLKPARLPDWDKYMDNPMTHLIAIGMNRYGEPIRLFTVNRWITSEIWYDAKHASNFINRFKMTLTDDPYWQVLDRWVQSMLHLFAPQITWLCAQRDNMIKQHQQNHPTQNAYEDENIEELSEVSINVQQQIQWILSQ